MTYYLNQKDFDAAQLYVLQNCEKVQPYFDIYVEYLREISPTASEAQIGQYISSYFATWFKQYVLNPENNIEDPLLVNLAWGPKRKVQSWSIYVINGYKFHTVLWSEGMNSTNYGVYVRGTNGQSESDFYGILSNIIQLEYTGFPIMNVVLFQCEWFDNTPNIGTKVDKNYEIVQVKESRRYNKAYDPFIFAQQAEQVYYTKYPEGHQGWLGVIKTKARIRIIDNTISEVEHDTPYQDDELLQLEVVLHVDPEFIHDSLDDVDGGGEEVDIQLLNETNIDEQYEEEYISSEDNIESDFSDTDTSS
ncbi:uncharacterized protein [Phaseolus vulgaris]|uniref:uncharacterized protein n=1 Tax=Phaseolus vulgaris TaxID=3885 RepID=UPI0035CC7BD2